jgi:hypothetical protein
VEKEIKISSNGGKTPEDLLKEWSANQTELVVNTFVNNTNGLCGLFISKKGDMNQIIDIYIKNDPPQLPSPR